jgi:hypothetical protein
LIGQKSKATNIYSEANQSNTERDNDYVILNYRTEKNQNLIEKLRLGTYSSIRMFFNPLTFDFTQPEQQKFSLSDYVDGVKNLGQQLDLPKISSSSNQDLGEIPTRIISQVYDVGTIDSTVSTAVNSDPYRYQSQAIMRYNILFTQTLSMVVPLNTNLHAGDVVTCNFPKISRGDKDEYDKDQSGLYMIKELCHHFDTNASYTSMKLIRDTYGKHGINNK